MANSLVKRSCRVNVEETQKMKGTAVELYEVDDATEVAQLKSCHPICAINSLFVNTVNTLLLISYGKC